MAETYRRVEEVPKIQRKHWYTFGGYTTSTDQAFSLSMALLHQGGRLVADTECTVLAVRGVFELVGDPSSGAQGIDGVAYVGSGVSPWDIAHDLPLCTFAAAAAGQGYTPQIHIGIQSKGMRRLASSAVGNNGILNPPPISIVTVQNNVSSVTCSMALAVLVGQR
jgi:hypothetical protein